MAVKYENIVPWGRNFHEYVKMFCLNESDMKKRIVGCGDGPASFNAEGTEKGICIVSVDPIYQYSKEQLEMRINETYSIVMEQVYRNKEMFLWEEFENPEKLGKARLEAMNCFINDFDKGKKENRYIVGEMPLLNIPDNSFDIALSSHFLFLYSDNLSYEFHVASIEEMLRIAGEARIFPIVDLNGKTSVYFEEICKALTEKGYKIEIIVSEYEFQKNGNRMLKIYRGE